MQNTLGDFKIQYTTSIINVMWYWHKDKWINETEENIQKQTCIYNRFFHRFAKAIQWDSFSNDAGIAEHPYAK